MSEKQLNPLNILEKKRSILQEVMTIAQSIEHIQGSLQNVILLGNPVSRLSPEVKQNYKYLENAYQSQPSNKLKEDVGKLDKYIQQNLVKILEIAGYSNQAPQAEVNPAVFEQHIIRLQSLIAAFKKSVLTSIALRVLLQKRGTTVDTLSLTVPETILHSQIAFLETKEKVYRAKAVNTIKEMESDINILLASNSVPKGMKDQLLKNKTNLLENIRHIEAGKSIETLPIRIESIDLSISVEEFETETIEIKAPELPERPSNLTGQVSEWLNSSWDTNWQDIKNKSK